MAPLDDLLKQRYDRVRDYITVLEEQSDMRFLFGLVRSYTGPEDGLRQYLLRFWPDLSTPDWQVAAVYHRFYHRWRPLLATMGVDVSQGTHFLFTMTVVSEPNIMEVVLALIGRLVIQGKKENKTDEEIASAILLVVGPVAPLEVMTKAVRMTCETIEREEGVPVGSLLDDNKK